MAEAIGLSLPQLRVSTRAFSDQRLARLASKGESRAFAAIYERYHQELYRYCQALLGNPQDAQDALQNAMVAAIRALPGEQREIKLKPWLYRVAHNAAMDVIRKRPPTQELDAEADVVAAGGESSAETRERLRELVVDLKALPERQRGALVMRELSGLSFEAIASSFETSPRVARQTVYEARVSLQQMAEGRDMRCEAVRRTLSDGDGRMLRRREIRSHLRSCRHCRDFQAAIEHRRADLTALAPLPAAVSAGLLQGILGGKGGSGGGTLLGLAGGGVGQTVAGSAALKLGVAVVAAGAIAVPAGYAAGAIELPMMGEGSNPDTPRTPAAVAVPKPSPPGTSGRDAGAKPAEDGPNAGHGPPSQLPDGAAHGQEVAASHRPDDLPAPARDRPSAPSGPQASPVAAPSQPSVPAQPNLPDPPSPPAPPPLP